MEGGCLDVGRSGAISVPSCMVMENLRLIRKNPTLDDSRVASKGVLHRDLWEEAWPAAIRGYGGVDVVSVSRFRSQLVAEEACSISWGI